MLLADSRVMYVPELKVLLGADMEICFWKQILENSQQNTIDLRTQCVF